MTSPVQKASATGEDTPTPRHSVVTRRKHQANITIRRSSRKITRPQSYEESSSEALTEPVSTQTQFKSDAASSTQDSAHGSQRKIGYQGDTPIPPRIPPSPQACEAVRTLNPIPQHFYTPVQSNSAQQQYCVPPNGFIAQENFLQDQQGSITSALSNIDPILLGLIFDEADTSNAVIPYSADPVLLSIGKPIRIPLGEVRHFYPIDTSTEEASDLALSDHEGDIGPYTTTGGTSGMGHVKKVRFTNSIHQNPDPGERKRKRLLGRKKRDSARFCSSGRKHKPVQVPSPIRDQDFAEEQTRFIILMRVYRGMKMDAIVDAFRREFEDDQKVESWPKKEIKKRLAVAKREPKFEEYRKILVKARDGGHKPERLGKRLLWEAKGFLERLRSIE